MLRTLLALGVLLAPMTLTELVLEAETPPPLVAGQPVTLPGTVHLEGPIGPMPGALSSVELAVDASPHARCAVEPSTLELGLLDGEAPFTLGCTPRRPGTFPVRVTAEDLPHASGAWETMLEVAPDALLGELTVGPVRGFTVPLALSVTPAHLPWADVNVTITAALGGTPLVFREGPFRMNATSTGTLEHALVARHGPGSYAVVVEVAGSWVEPLRLAASVDVPDPRPTGELDLNVTVLPPDPRVSLTLDTVNADGKTKRPGEVLTTRLLVERATSVNVTVMRAASPEPVVLAAQTLAVPPDGLVQHTFTAPALPEGLVIVQAAVGSSSVARTGQIVDVAPVATVTGPASALGDGRPLAFDVRVLDANFGSTALDPGPIWGVPDLTWKIFRGSSLVSGWTSRLGPYDGDSSGQAATSLLAWPQGAEWAVVGDGRVDLALWLVPPLSVAPGTYRVSIYDDAGVRLGGASFDLLPPPHVALAAGGPVPGTPLAVTVNVADPIEGLAASLSVRVGDGEVQTLAWTGPDGALVPLPDALPAGTPVRVEAWATWPGRPPAALPDAALDLLVPALPPTLVLHAAVDGAPVAPPLPLHPAAAHVVDVAASTHDPNGDPVTVSAAVFDPAGAPVPWALTTGPALRLEVPAGASPGRYTLEATARAADGEARATMALDVAPVTRVSVVGPREVRFPQGGSETLAVEVTNAGTTPLAGIVVVADLPPGLEVAVLSGGARFAAGTLIPASLQPGASLTLVVELGGAAPPRGAHAGRLVVAGVPE